MKISDSCYGKIFIRQNGTEHHFSFRYPDVSYQEFKAQYKAKESFLSKKTTIPLALVALVKAIAHLAFLILWSLPTVCFNPKSLQLHAFSVVRYLEEAAGRMIYLFHPVKGAYYCEESFVYLRMYKLTVHKRPKELVQQTLPLQQTEPKIVQKEPPIDFAKSQKLIHQELLKKQNLLMEKFLQHCDQSLFYKADEVVELIKNDEMQDKMRVILVNYCLLSKEPMNLLKARSFILKIECNELKGFSLVKLLVSAYKQKDDFMFKDALKYMILLERPSPDILKRLEPIIEQVKEWVASVGQSNVALNSLKEKIKSLIASKDLVAKLPTEPTDSTL